MNRSLRRPLSCLLFLSWAGALQAFPFQLGRAMEYSVLRKGGAEASGVTLIPLDTALDSLGTNWRFSLTDSSTKTDLIRRDTIVMRVAPASMTWTKSSCLLPWDLGEVNNNEVRTPGLGWGGLALKCGGARGQKLAQSSSGYRFIEYVQTIGTNMTYTTMTDLLPPVQGVYSEDSGWLSLYDSYLQEIWVLSRIGNGARYQPDGGVAAQSWIEVHAGDRWNWRKTFSWSDSGSKSPGQPTDRRGGSRDEEVRWTALERLSDSVGPGTWRFERARPGVLAETLQVDFGSPFLRMESMSYPDLDLDVFRRGSCPSWRDPAATTRTAGWSHNVTSTDWREGNKRTRNYEYIRGRGVSKMTQSTLTYLGYEFNPTWTNDSTTTLELQSVTRAELLPAGLAREAGRAPIRTLRGLEELAARGGRILSIRGATGRELPGPSGNPLEALRAVRGIVFVECAAPSGARTTFAVLLP